MICLMDDPKFDRFWLNKADREDSLPWDTRNKLETVNFPTFDQIFVREYYETFPRSVDQIGATIVRQEAAPIVEAESIRSGTCSITILQKTQYSSDYNPADCKDTCQLIQFFNSAIMILIRCIM